MILSKLFAVLSITFSVFAMISIYCVGFTKQPIHSEKLFLARHRHSVAVGVFSGLAIVLYVTAALLKRNANWYDLLLLTTTLPGIFGWFITFIAIFAAERVSRGLTGWPMAWVTLAVVVVGGGWAMFMSMVMGCTYAFPTYCS